MARLISLFSIVVGLVAFCLALALAGNALSYLNFDFTYGFLRLKLTAIATGWYLPAYYSHVLLGGIILVIGFIQLSRTWGLRWKKLHRIMGYVYVMGVLFLSAPGGLIMSFFINRGPLVLLSFITQASLWFYFTATAFNLIRKHDVASHQRWMWRSYSLTFAAVTLRLYIYFCSYFVDLGEPIAYGILSWLSWLPNLVAVEFYWNYKQHQLTAR